MPGVGMPMRDKEIMEKLFDLKKLTTVEISTVLGCSVQVVQKRKREYEQKDTITAVKEMSWQKIKAEHREVLLRYVEEHGENKSLREMSEYLAQATGVKVTEVTIGRMLKAHTASAEGQARRKIRAPRSENVANGAPWIAPEAQRATPYMSGDRVGWTLQQQQNASLVAQQQPTEGESATSPSQQQVDAQLGVSPASRSQSMSSHGTPAMRPQQVEPQPIQISQPPARKPLPGSGVDANDTPMVMDDVEGRETPSDSAEDSGDV